MRYLLNKGFEKYGPSVQKIYTYNLLRENDSFGATRVANEYRDVGHIARVMDFLVRGRQLQYKSARMIIGRIHERKDLAQYKVQQQTFVGGTFCRSLQVHMDGLGKVKKIVMTKDFNKLPEKYRRDFYVSAYFQALGKVMCVFIYFSVGALFSLISLFSRALHDLYLHTHTANEIGKRRIV
jgi:hypothetical protein